MSDEALGIPTYVSLCSGYDGIGLGLKRVIPNLQTLAHCEIEAYAIAGLIAKMETGQLDACPVFSDIKHFPFRELRGRIGILSAGFPCQPFSSAGRRQSTEDPRHIYPRIADGISVCLPQYVFLENVRGIVSAKTADGESVLKYVLEDLESRGYRTEWGLFSAEETGAPHQRIRCFILAYSPNLGPKWSSRPNKESSSYAIEGCGDRSPTSRELAHPASRSARRELRDMVKEDAVEGRSQVQHEDQTGQLKRRSEQTTELANPTSREPRQPQARNGGQDTSGGSEEELGNSGIERCEQDSALRDKQQARGVEQVCGDRGSEEELGNTARLDGKQSNAETDQVGRACEEDRGSSDVRRTEWPSRPGEEQYEWEEPRVTETQSELGGTVDGSRSGVDAIANRVDRLRLLGNGVVPQTAELAWRTLWKQLNDKYDD